MAPASGDGNQLPAGAGERGPVLFVSYSGLWGGAERVALDVLSGLAEPAVLLCAAGPLADRAEAARVPVLRRPARALELQDGPRGRAGAVLRLAAHAREVRAVAASLRPRAVVAWGMRSAMACAVARRTMRRRPPLLFEHGDFLPGGGAGLFVRAAARCADRVIASSAGVAADLDPRGRLEDRLRIALPGVDLERFRPSPTPPGARVLVLGAIVPWKRPDLALEIAALAARELPELRLVLAGHAVGPGSRRLLDALRRRAAEPDLAGRVELPGPLPDPAEALRGSSCLLHCADREPFGVVLVEAMASGRPVIAPAAGGPLEIVSSDCGRLFPPGDAHAGARAVVELLGDRDKARRAGERGRLRAEERFGLASAGRRWREAAAPVLGGAGPSEAGGGLTLVTVTHDSEHELGRLLASVARHLPGAAVVVVDSGSQDGSAGLARGWPGEAAVMELENVGYGRAVNAGLDLVDTPACVVLNPDIELVDDSLAALAAEAIRPDARERLLAPLVERPDGTRQDSVHPPPLSPAAALTALVPPAVLPPPLRPLVQPWRANRPRAVGWAVGCCLGARTDTLRRLGPFDERIFLYAEDLELGLRAGDAGIETWWWPRARVIHHEAHAMRRVFGAEAFELLARQRHAVLADRRGDRLAHWDDRLQLATFANRVALKTLSRRSTERERRQLSALLEARRERPRLEGP